MLVVLSALAISCGTARGQTPSRSDAIRSLQRIAIVIEKDVGFTVFDERGRVGKAPASAYGLGGGAVVSAADSLEDRKTTETVAARLGAPSCRARFQAALERTLRDSGRIGAVVFPDLEQSRHAALDAVAAFAIESCGFRRREGGEMAAFIDVSARLELADGATAWDHRETMIVPTHASRDRLLEEPESVRRDFEQVLDDAGARMANELLYP